MRIYEKNMELILLTLISLLCLFIPLIKNIFKNIYTLIHEFFHAITAVLTSGNVLKIELYFNNEGIAVTKTKSKISSFLVSISGYAVSSIFAYFLSFLLLKNNNYYIIYIVGSISIISLLFFIRNLYAILWIIGFIGFLIFSLLFKNNVLIYYTTILISLILIFESLLSPLILNYIYFKNKKGGDAENLKSITKIPIFIWLLVFDVIAVYFFYLSSLNYIKLLKL